MTFFRIKTLCLTSLVCYTLGLQELVAYTEYVTQPTTGNTGNSCNDCSSSGNDCCDWIDALNLTNNNGNAPQIILQNEKISYINSATSLPNYSAGQGLFATSPLGPCSVISSVGGSVVDFAGYTYSETGSSWSAVYCGGAYNQSEAMTGSYLLDNVIFQNGIITIAGGQVQFNQSDILVNGSYVPYSGNTWAMYSYIGCDSSNTTAFSPLMVFASGGYYTQSIDDTIFLGDQSPTLQVLSNVNVTWSGYILNQSSSSTGGMSIILEDGTSYLTISGQNSYSEQTYIYATTGTLILDSNLGGNSSDNPYFSPLGVGNYIYPTNLPGSSTTNLNTISFNCSGIFGFVNQYFNTTLTSGWDLYFGTNFNSSLNITLANSFSGDDLSVIWLGPGTITFSGAFYGTTVILTDGTLILPTSPNYPLILNGGTLLVPSYTQLSTTGTPVTLNNSYVEQITNTAASPITLQGGLSFLSGSNSATVVSTIGGGSVFVDSGNSTTVTGPAIIANAYTEVIFDGPFVDASSSTGLYPLQLSGSGTIVLNGTGTYSCGTIVNAFVSLNTSSSGSPVFQGPLGTGLITMESPGLLLATATMSLGNSVTISSQQSGAFAADVDSSSSPAAPYTFTLSGTVNVSGNVAINPDGYAGIVEMQSPTLSGAITIDGGTLLLSGAPVMSPTATKEGTPPITINGAILELDCTSDLNSAYGITFVGGCIIQVTGSPVTFTGPIASESSSAFLTVSEGLLSLLPTSASTSGATLPYIAQIALAGGTVLNGNCNALAYSIISTVPTTGTPTLSYLVFQDSSNNTYYGGQVGNTKAVSGISGDIAVIIDVGSSVTLTFDSSLDAGANTYTGGTTFTNGTLSISADCLGDSSGTLTGNGGTLQIAPCALCSPAVTIDRPLAVNLVASYGLTFDVVKGNTLTYSGTITGSGDINIIGDFTYTGTSSDYTGTIYVNGVQDTGNTTDSVSYSTFTNNGTLTNDPIVEPGGLLTGHGLVRFVEVRKHGYLAGSQTVTDYIDFQSGAGFTPTIGDGSITEVGGTVTIGSGSSVYLALLAGHYSKSQSTVVLTSAGGISGQFDTLFIPAASFLKGDITGDTSQIEVVYYPNTVLDGPIHGANARAVRDSLDEIIDWNRANVSYVADPRFGLRSLYPFAQISDVLYTFGVLTEAQVPEALNACQSSFLKSQLIVQQDSSTQVQGSLRQRLENRMDTENCTLDKYPYNIWMEGLGSSIRQKKHGVGYNSQMEGVILGIDTTLGGALTFGALGGYTSAHLKWEDQLGRGNANAGYLGLYGSLRGEMFYGNLAVTGGWNIYNATRNISYTGVSLQAYNSHAGKQLLSHADTGINIRLGYFTLRTFDSLDYLTQTENAYTESGAGEWNLSVRKNNAILLRNELGLEFAGCHSMTYGIWSIAPKFSWVREVRVRGGSSQEGFEGTDAFFTVTGYFPCRSLFSPGLRVTGDFLDSRLGFSLYYNGEFGSGYSANQYGGSVSVNF